MEWLHHNGNFLGIEWTWWKIVGWIGNLTFASRVIVQWYASEKKQQVVVPLSFWWLSLIGSIILLAYSLFYKHDSVFIFSFALNWVPYVRNLIIHYRHMESRLTCSACGVSCPPHSNYCYDCGAPLAPAKDVPAKK